MWKCKKCNEELEDNFDACWNCGTLKESDEMIADLSEPSAEDNIQGISLEETKELGDLGSEKAIDTLAKEIKHGNSKKIRIAAANALMSIYRKLQKKLRKERLYMRSIEALEEPIKHIIPALNDPDTEVRKIAAKLLAKSRLEISVDPLIDTLDCDSDASIRCEIACALTNFKEPITASIYDKNAIISTVVSELISRLSDNEPKVRSAAAFALKKFNKEGTYDLFNIHRALRNALNDPYWEVRKQAILTISVLPSYSGIRSMVKDIISDPYVKLLDDEKPEVRFAAVEAMTNIRHIPGLNKALDNDNEGIRNMAQISLNKLGHKKQ